MKNNLDKKIKEMLNQRNQALIYKALGFNSETYSTMVFDSGFEWIKNNWCCTDDEIVSVIAQCRLFWAWYRNQWNLRDKQFIYETSLEKQELPLIGECYAIAIDLYYEAHRNAKLVPNRFVILEVSTALRNLTALQTQKLKQLIYEKK